ncbi:hypothetical protein Taro_034457 [Colocasia esculenta]|uniref:ACT domain-containing protein ACR n=1 Tax=Colocasia esculenta TaxID=4460 RepID=A0A843W0W7_COLES|nr:hypothetical protein [Colocasia esculenta]
MGGRRPDKWTDRGGRVQQQQSNLAQAFAATASRHAPGELIVGTGSRLFLFPPLLPSPTPHYGWRPRIGIVPGGSSPRVLIRPVEQRGSEVPAAPCRSRRSNPGNICCKREGARDCGRGLLSSAKRDVNGGDVDSPVMEDVSNGLLFEWNLLGEVKVTALLASDSELTIAGIQREDARAKRVNWKERRGKVETRAYCRFSASCTLAIEWSPESGLTSIPSTRTSASASTRRGLPLSSAADDQLVSVDNASCGECTLVKVDSVNKPGILLELVQVLSDLDLTITKAYISSDGGWFMDVFHVKDQQGRKITDRKTIEHIEMALGPKSNVLSRSGNSWPTKPVGMHSIGDYVAIELIGADRPGLLSEIFAVLANLHCNVLAAEVWTHNMRVACVVYVNDGATCGALDDPNRLRIMEEQLTNVLRVWKDDHREPRTNFSMGYTHVDRRLHQLMFADKDYESDVGDDQEKDISHTKPIISIEQCEDKGYSVVNVQCKDRPKLLFDIVCTLTDMQYAVFHASVSSEGPKALQEYYIRHMDGCTLESKEEKERVIKCLEAAIRRRISEGISLELCGRDRVGLLSDVTRILRENGLSVTRAGVTTVGEQAVDVFYVRDCSGNPVDMKAIEALRQEIGQTVMLNVKRVPNTVKAPRANGWVKPSFSFGSLFERFLA